MRDPTNPLKSYSNAVTFHVHACPGLALGYRATHYAMDALKAGRSDDEEHVCIAENDACGVDAIQIIAGCSIGKGNLILEDFGKHAYTFIDRRYNRAIQFVQRPEPQIERIDPNAAVLRQKKYRRYCDPCRTKGISKAKQAAIIEKILDMPMDELFIIKEVGAAIPERARIFRSVRCASCGEMVQSSVHR